MKLRCTKISHYFALLYHMYTYSRTVGTQYFCRQEAGVMCINCVCFHSIKEQKPEQPFGSQFVLYVCRLASLLFVVVL